MQCLEVKSTAHAPKLIDDTALLWPAVPRPGRLNLIGQGHALRLNGGEMNGFRVFEAAHFSKLETEDLRGNFCGSPTGRLAPQLQGGTLRGEKLQVHWHSWRADWHIR